MGAAAVMIELGHLSCHGSAQALNLLGVLSDELRQNILRVFLSSIGSESAALRDHRLHVLLLVCCLLEGGSSKSILNARS